MPDGEFIPDRHVPGKTELCIFSSRHNSDRSMSPQRNIPEIIYV